MAERQAALAIAAKNPWGACSCEPFEAAAALDRQGTHTLVNFGEGEFSIAGRPLLVNNADHRDNDDTGLSVWDGSVVLAKWMERRDRDGAPVVRGRRVLELGCGTGLAGLSALLLGAQHVTLTDLAYTLPAAQANLARNERSVLPGTCDVCELDWCCAQPPSCVADAEVFLAADVVWRADLVLPLLKILSVCLAAGAEGKGLGAAARATETADTDAAAAARCAAVHAAAADADCMGLESFVCEQRPVATAGASTSRKECFLCYTFRFDDVHRAFFGGLDAHGLSCSKLDPSEVYGDVFLPTQTGVADPVAHVYRIIMAK